MEKPITNIHSVASIAERLGGVSSVVPRMVSALAAEAGSGAIVELCAPGIPNDLAIVPGLGGTLRPTKSLPAYYLDHFKYIQGHLSAERIVVHDHGIWHSLNVATTYVTRSNKIPYVISPHGMLEPWAFAHRSMKKKFFWHLIQRSLIRGASCLVASSKMEHDNIKVLDAQVPIALIPFGADLEDIRPISVEDAKAKRPGLRTALFLSRIHPKKGLAELIDAWAHLRPPDWKLRIVGPNELDHRSQLERLVNKYGLRQSISFEDFKSGYEKRQCLAEAEILLLPSHSENFGVVVVEALAAGLPVLTTTGTPWSALPRNGCGWWVDMGAGALVTTLREIFNTTPATLKLMGEKGREWVSTEYAWPMAAKRLLQVYGWILDGGVRPDFVYA